MLSIIPSTASKANSADTPYSILTVGPSLGFGAIAQRYHKKEYDSKFLRHRALGNLCVEFIQTKRVPPNLSRLYMSYL